MNSMLKSLLIFVLLASAVFAAPDFAEAKKQAEAENLRKEEMESINKADGFTYILGSRRPIKLENGIHYHGWLYNEELDAAIIQYTYSGRIYNSHKEKMAHHIGGLWKGELGARLQKMGFQDLAMMITEGIETSVYSSRREKWYTVDGYLALRL